MANYGTAAAVKARTGIEPADLGYEDAPSLDAFLVGLLEEVSDLMNRRMRRDYLAELAAGTIASIPAGLDGIANDIAANAVREMVVTRQTPVVRVDDFAVRTLSSRMFSGDIVQRLRLYGRSGASTVDVTPGDMAETSSDVITAKDLDGLDL